MHDLARKAIYAAVEDLLDDPMGIEEMFDTDEEDTNEVLLIIKGWLDGDPLESWNGVR